MDMGFPPDEVFRVMADREMSISSQTTQTADTVMEVGKKQYFDEIPIITLCPTTLEPNDIGCAFLQLLKDRTENNRLSIWSIPLQIEQPEYGDPNSSNSDAVPSATQPESCSPDPNQSMPEQEQEDVSLKRKRSISESNEVKPLAAELDADEEGQDEDEEPASKRFTRRSKITRSSNVGPTSNQDALSENYQSINRILMSFGLSLGTNHRANIEPDDLIMTQCDDIVSRLLEELKKSNALTASGTPVKRRGRKARVTLNPEGISQTVTLEDILEFVARQENVESGRSAVLDLATISTDSVLDGVHSYIDACFAPKEWTTHWPSGLRPTLVELLLYLISNDISLHTNVNVADESVEQLLHTQRLQVDILFDFGCYLKLTRFRCSEIITCC
ncbi:hypothetical protein BKA69DRAFT_722187 [Paraphysoderma sedebokerense]|nr:hypothetical protein BKA69DRAFT_722187 [Paraphysoderma sedebokerense]